MYIELLNIINMQRIFFCRNHIYTHELEQIFASSKNRLQTSEKKPHAVDIFIKYDNYTANKMWK